MHVIDEPYLMGMRKMVMKLWRKPGLSGFHANKPDSGRPKFLTLIFEQGKPPTPQAGVLVTLLQYGSFDFFGDLAVSASVTLL